MHRHTGPRWNRGWAKRRKGNTLVKPGFISDEQARKALERARAEGRVQLSPAEEDQLRATEKRQSRPWNRLRRLFPRTTRPNS